MEALLGELSKERRAGLVVLRDWLDEHLGGRPELVFYDASWCWCERFAVGDSKGGDLGEVYLIPDPERSRVGICFHRHIFEKGNLGKLSRSVQTSLGDGVCVGHLAWVECEVGSEGDAEQVCELLTLLAGLAEA
jgi:hypothetical protein